MQIAGVTDVGKIREQNEDSYCLGENFVAVADGMGGHNKGEVASRMVTDLISEKLKKETCSVSKETLEKLLATVNRAVYNKSVTDESCSGMGTTVVMCVWDDEKILVAYIGDSRCYALRNGELVQLTKDHTLVQNLLDAGKITDEEVATYPNRHVITKAVGTEPEEQPDILEIEREDGLSLLFCSDGLSNLVSGTQMQETVMKYEKAEDAVNALKDAANANGGTDNITVVLVKF